MDTFKRETYEKITPSFTCPYDTLLYIYSCYVLYRYRYMPIAGVCRTIIDDLESFSVAA